MRWQQAIEVNRPYLSKLPASWEQAAHLFGFDDALHTDRHRGCAMRHPVILRASDYLHKRMLEDAKKFVRHF
jgi:hypothetical protein